jgi:hypothetical protein
LSITGGVGISTNTGIQSLAPLTPNSDTNYLVVPHSGAFVPTSGTFSTTNPKIMMPMNGVFKASVFVQWTTNVANFTNTWGIRFAKNGASLGDLQRNGDGGCTSGGLNFMMLEAKMRIGVAAGEYMQVLLFQDLAIGVPAWISGAQINFKSYKAIKDL